MRAQTEETKRGEEFSPVDLVMNPKALVVKSNDLVESRQRLSVQEQRIILLLISKIRLEDVDFLWYKFKIRDLAKFLGLETSNRIYVDVRKAIRKLIKRVITFDRKGRNIDLNWIQAAEYGEKGYVKICINHVLKPYLLNLKSHFTKYSINHVVHLRSTYSIRIYELLKRYENLGEVTFEVDRLKFILGLKTDEYTLYGNFKNKVVLVAQKELIDKTDVSFDFEEEKDGKKVVRLCFKIKKNDPKKKIPAPPESPPFICEEPLKRQQEVVREELGSLEDDRNSLDECDGLVKLIPEKFRGMKSIQKVIRRAFQEYGYDYVARNIKYANTKSNALKPGLTTDQRANYSAYLSKTLAGDFGLSFHENEELKLAEKALAEHRRQEEEAKRHEEAKRQAREEEERGQADAVIQTLSESELSELRKQAIDKLPPELQKSRFSSMMVKLEMQKIILERTNAKPPLSDPEEPNSE